MAIDSKKILKASNVFFQEQRWEKALEGYLELLEVDPRDMALQTLIADLYVKTENFKASFSAYQKARDGYLKLGASDKLLLVRKKIAALNSSSFDDEMKMQQDLIKMGLDADLAIEKGNLDQAQTLFEKMSSTEPGNLATRDRLADIYIQKNLVEKAIAELLILGNSCSKVRAHAQAEEYFQKIIELQPNHLQARSNLAVVNQRRGNDREATKQYLTISQMLLEAGEFEKALPFAQKANELRSIEASFILGRIAMHKGDNTEAARRFTYLLRFKVAHVGALTHLAVVKAAEGDLDQALATMGLAISAQPDNPDLVERQGEYYAKKGSMKEAAEAFCKAAESFISKQKFDKAKELLERAVEIQPEGKKEKKSLSQFLRDQGMEKDASQVLEALGDLYQKEDSMEEALAAFQEALALDSSNSSVSGKISSLAGVQTGTVKKAASSSPVPLDLPPSLAGADAESPSSGVSPGSSATEPRVSTVAAASSASSPTITVGVNTDVIRWLTMGDVYAEKGLFEDALAHYRKAEAVEPSHPGLGDKIRRVVQDLNQKIQEEARKVAEAAAQTKLEEEARKKEEEDVAKKREKEAREAAEKKAEEARKQAEKEVREQAEAAAKKEAEEEATRKAEEEARQQAEAAAKKEAEEEAKIKNERAARLRADDERAKKTQIESKKETAKASESKSTSGEKSHANEPDEEEYMTVSVAEIYRRRGQKSQAIRILKKILNKQPTHREAAKKLAEIQGKKIMPGQDTEAAKNKEPKPASKPTKKPEKRKKVKSRISYI